MQCTCITIRILAAALHSRQEANCFSQCVDSFPPRVFHPLPSKWYENFSTFHGHVFLPSRGNTLPDSNGVSCGLWSQMSLSICRSSSRLVSALHLPMSSSWRLNLCVLQNRRLTARFSGQFFTPCFFSTCPSIWLLIPMLRSRQEFSMPIPNSHPFPNVRPSPIPDPRNFRCPHRPHRSPIRRIIVTLRIGKP